MNDATLKVRFDRIDRLILNLHSTLNLQREIIMETLDTLNAKMADLKTAADTAKADADAARADSAALAAQNEQTIGLLQALTAKIAELAALVANGGFTPAAQAQLDALGVAAQSAIDTLAAAKAQADAANNERDAALAAQAQAVTDATPAP